MQDPVESHSAVEVVGSCRRVGSLQLLVDSLPPVVDTLPLVAGSLPPVGRPQQLPSGCMGVGWGRYLGTAVEHLSCRQYQLEQRMQTKVFLTDHVGIHYMCIEDP